MIGVAKYSREEWARVSEWVHAAVHGTIKPAAQDRFDYVLLAFRDQEPGGYVSVRETDADSVYWQFGGALPPARGSMLAWTLFRTILDKQFETANRVSMAVVNTNRPMLRFALQAGFTIVGVRYFKGKTLVEFLKER